MNNQPLFTALHDWHQDNGARLVDFAGWEMPIQYTSIMDEHNATRKQATLFDVSHMARIYIEGSDAEDLIDGLTTRKIKGMGRGKIRYSLLCNSTGGILDDILVYHLPDDTYAGSDKPRTYLLVVNASNREKILKWIDEQRAGKEVIVEDRTVDSAMIAFQGPMAIEKINPHLDFDVSSLRYFNAAVGQLNGINVLVSRTGYTGEDGCEIIVENKHARDVWELLVSDELVSAAGLGARDTLRLEAAMPLYGHELSEQINASQTELGFALSLKDRDFVGKSAIEDGLRDLSQHGRIGLVLDGKRTAREGSKIYNDDDLVGEVTSGTFSPTLQQPIAMGYIDRNLSAAGTKVSVDIRGKRIDATVTPLPFYKREQ